MCPYLLKGRLTVNYGYLEALIPTRRRSYKQQIAYNLCLCVQVAQSSGLGESALVTISTRSAINMLGVFEY